VRGFWPVEELELADRRTGYGKVVRGGCLLASSE
jgi:hypothetical protein